MITALEKVCRDLEKVSKIQVKMALTQSLYIYIIIIIIIIFFLASEYTKK